MDGTDLTQFDMDAVSLQLEEMNYTGTAIEFHAQLCGLLSAGRRLNAETWLKQAAEWLDVDPNTLAGPHEAWLLDWYDHCLQVLSDPEGSFTPMVDEDAMLRRVAEELAMWCEAFLFGAGLVLNNDSMKDGDTTEIFSDLTSISQLEVPMDPDEEDSAAFTEIYEFVRVAVLNLFVQFDPVVPESDTPAQ